MGHSECSQYDRIDAKDYTAIQKWIQNHEHPTVSDGYISGAIIFADVNGNGKLDDGEASTTSDANGKFTPFGEVAPLVASGGTDISTGLPFEGTLQAPWGSTAITPLTTLVSGLQSTAALSLNDAQQKVTAALGLPDNISLTTLDADRGNYERGCKQRPRLSDGGQGHRYRRDDRLGNGWRRGIAFTQAYADTFAALGGKINALSVGQTINLSDQATVTPSSIV